MQRTTRLLLTVNGGMTPTELRAFVDALKDAGLMSCAAKVPVAGGVLELALVFGPAPMVPEMSAPVTAGGWKGPERLDAHFEDELPPLLPPKTEA